MIKYEELRRTPAAFHSLTGHSVAAFDQLLQEWSEADREARATATTTRREGRPRQRAPGAGRKHALEGPTRLLLALVWLKVYPTWEVLGYLFGVEERTARRTTRDVLRDLEALARFPLEERDRPRGRNLAAVVEAHPVQAFDSARVHDPPKWWRSIEMQG